MLNVKIVAIKKMDLPTSKQADGEREFRVEIDILSRLDHPNLVTLIGYCADGKHRFVVYEFMPRGNLQDILNGMVTPQYSLFRGGRMMFRGDTLSLTFFFFIHQALGR